MNSAVNSFWDVLWIILITFAFVAYLMLLFSIIGDLFRDHKLSGWWKAVWVFFLIFVPFLTALIYLIARGEGMTRRSLAAAQVMKSEQDAYIKEVAGKSPADQISAAKALLDEGTITEAEFQSLKSKALG
ncbi:SHOCT domain-containing protein [Rhodococcus olei]|uniref:SHOCT domain-containing protein n=1 Tax=Rhodococcus olei TaxID=2161675 RepID=A0ABP8P3T4_9NOCA